MRTAQPIPSFPRRDATRRCTWRAGSPTSASTPCTRVRCNERETAAPLAEIHGLEVVVDDELAEYDRDSHWYVPVEELKAANDPRWKEIVSGSWGDVEVDPETFRDVVFTAVERLIEANPSRRIAAVCHGGVINAYISKILGIANATGFFYPNYTSIHRVIGARTGERTVLTLNESAHLRGTGLTAGLYG